MIGYIQSAILQETKVFLQSIGSGQTMLKTNFDPKETPDYNLPLVLVDFQDASDTYQFPGGLTFVGWKIDFDCYNYSPDAYVDDNSDYSTSLIFDPVDTIRRHFSLGALGNGLIYQTGELTVGIVYKVTNGSITYNSTVLANGTYFTAISGFTTFTTTNGGYCIGTSWKTQAMVNIFNSVGFQMTLSGVQRADPIPHSTGLVLGYKTTFDSTSLDDHTNFIEDDIELQTITQNTPNEPIS
jgi:hypothetical protein